ncbi:MAG: hypothetical protein WEF50_16975 [Myxococcota bacterium]
MSDVVPYRTLTRADFKAAAPPAPFAANADRLGAATCCYIVVAPGARIMSREVRSESGPVRYSASVSELVVRAQMDRRCSWWNPKDTGLPQDYVLEHEQIHFAICELEARRLNASLREFTSTLSITAESAQAAAQLVQDRVNERVQRQSTALTSRSRDFDEDTSLGHKPEAQKRWLSRVRAELAETRGD